MLNQRDQEGSHGIRIVDSRPSTKERTTAKFHGAQTLVCMILEPSQSGDGWELSRFGVQPESRVLKTRTV